MFIFEIVAKGHENIKAEHRTTLEVTKEKDLTPRGDCIIGVAANISASEIPDKAKELLRVGTKAEVEILLPDYGLRDVLVGFGSRDFTFQHDTDVVIRKSKYICGRTVLISSNKAARDINREIVELLKDKKTEVILRFKLAVPQETGQQNSEPRKLQPKQ